MNKKLFVIGFLGLAAAITFAVYILTAGQGVLTYMAGIPIIALAFIASVFVILSAYGTYIFAVGKPKAKRVMVYIVSGIFLFTVSGIVCLDSLYVFKPLY